MEEKCSRELLVHVKVEPVEETNRGIQEVTSSSEHIIKTEPPWPAWAVAEKRGVGGGAAGEGLYADHVVKDELVLGPERLHRPRPGGALLVSRTMPADRDSRQQPHLALKDCTVRLERIPYNTLLARTKRTSEMEDIDIYNTDSEIPMEHIESHIYVQEECEVNGTMPADRHSRQEPQLALKDCTVRLKRIPYSTLLARTERTSEMEEIDCIHPRPTTPLAIPLGVGRNGTIPLGVGRDGTIPPLVVLGYDGKIEKKVGTMPADRDSRQQPHLALKDCTVRLERIPYNTLLARTERTSEMEEIDCIYNTDSEIPMEHVVSHIYVQEECEVNAPPPAARAAQACPARLERCDAVPSDSQQKRNKGIQHTYACDTCGKVFDDKVVLVRHIRAHAQEKYSKKSKFVTSKGSKTSKLYSREICNEKFTKKHNVMEHRYIHSGKKPYSCDICRKQFTQKGSLTIHLLIHTGQKPYCCEICKRRFFQRGNLMRHKAFIHRDMISEDKWRMRTMTVMCTICNKPYVDLKTHIVIQTGEKPYFCDICQKKFTHRSNMREHKRIHTGERPYCCTVCAKKFRKISDLYRHERLHTGIKPYSCEICKRKFYRSDHLTGHYKRTHLPLRKKRGRPRQTNSDQVNDDDVLPDASADGDVKRQK